MTDEVVTNLRVLAPSRKAPRPGDLFAMQLPDESFLHGRVISTEAKAGPSMPGAILVYVYDSRSDSCTDPDLSALRPDRLLLGPIMTNRKPWSKGYFQTIANQPLHDDDVLTRNCFVDSRGRYLDEKGNILPGPVEPVGTYGLHSYRSIDDAVSDALGLPRA
jgi:hypothetical protein